MMVLLGSLTVLPAGLTLAADHEQGQDRNKTPLQEQDQDRDRIFGHEMMTDEERNEYMSRMHSATTAQERERIREENHQRMVERARERGITLPDEPMGGPMGSGKGMGSGMGGGGGSSGGMGGGMGRDNDHGNKK